VRIRY